MSSDFAAALRKAFDEQGVTDNDIRAAIAAICMGESQMIGHSETGYAHTSNARIRKVFGERVRKLSDAQLDALKADDRKWFDFIYNYSNPIGADLGNTQPDDGYNYRGRGIIQLTGRANYQHFGQAIGHPELLSNPELANDPEIAALLAVEYIDERYADDGSLDFDKMMKCVGTCTPDIVQHKRQYFEQYKHSGEFDYRVPEVRESETVAPTPVQALPASGQSSPASGQSSPASGQSSPASGWEGVVHWIEEHTG